jgi:hypothetical protein
MSEGGDSPAPLSASARRIVVRLAETACPPEVRTGGRAARVLAEFESLLPVLPPAVRRAVRAGLAAFDQGARLYPAARGRRFASLGDVTADSYFLAVLSRRGAGLGTLLQRIKGLVVMCYYELPDVKDELGYRPDAYIAAVAGRRLASYGSQIRAGEIAVLASDSGDGDSMPPAPIRRKHP